MNDDSFIDKSHWKIIICPNCSQKNRVQNYSPGLRPICGKCAYPLEPIDQKDQFKDKPPDPDNLPPFPSDDTEYNHRESYTRMAMLIWFGTTIGCFMALNDKLYDEFISIKTFVFMLIGIFVVSNIFGFVFTLIFGFCLKKLYPNFQDYILMEDYSNINKIIKMGRYIKYMEAFIIFCLTALSFNTIFH